MWCSGPSQQACPFEPLQHWHTALHPTMYSMLTPILSSLSVGEYQLVCALEASELGMGNVGHYTTRNFDIVAGPPPPPPSGPYGFAYISGLTPDTVRSQCLSWGQL